jgi:hypothetical protein
LSSRKLAFLNLFGDVTFARFMAVRGARSKKSGTMLLRKNIFR